MYQATIHPTFNSWRKVARDLLAASIEPAEVLWSDGSEFSLPLATQPIPSAVAQNDPFKVPPAFVSLASTVSMHRDTNRWALLYRLLFRLTHGERHLLHISVDEDVHRLREMEKAVSRDIHKMHAFVRFRRVMDEQGAEEFIAFHRPDHLIVPAAGPWFAKRFAIMRWTILTPDASVSWDCNSLKYGPGVSKPIVADDELEDLWKTYYAHIFNPARIKIAAMKKEMPIRHWKTMPETDLIDDLLREAPDRVEEMVMRNQPKAADKPVVKSAAEFVPVTTSLNVLREAATTCKGCELYCNATQTVFGEGPVTAHTVFVGEQPGDQEDLAGKPFVGPAGQLWNEALLEAGIDRSQCYVTNAVKHFKFEQRGTRRIHAKPSAREVGACRPWLEAEMKIIQPRMIIALGATAAQSMMGPQFRITKSHGQVFKDTPWAPWFMATIHPSALLRIPDPVLRAQSHREFIEDLKVAAAAIDAGV